MGRARPDRPTVRRAKGKAFHTHHHRAIRIIFKEVKIATSKDEEEGSLARDDVPRLMNRAFHDLPAKYSYRHLYDRWIGRFKDKKPAEWWEIDRPNQRNKQAYTQAELDEFTRLRTLLVQAADDLDIAIPWLADGETGNDEQLIEGHEAEQDVEMTEGLEHEESDAGDNRVELDEPEEGDMEMNSDGGEAVAAVEGDEELRADEEVAIVEQDADQTEATPQSEHQETLMAALSPHQERDGDEEDGALQNPSSATTGAAVLNNTTTSASGHATSNVCSLSAADLDVLYSGDFDAINDLLLDARLAAMNRVLDNMDWSLPKETAAERIDRERKDREERENEAYRRTHQPTAKEAEDDRTQAHIMRKLNDPTDPYVRCCGDWSDEVLGRPRLHLGEGTEEERLFGFKVTLHDYHILLKTYLQVYGIVHASFVRDLSPASQETMEKKKDQASQEKQQSKRSQNDTGDPEFDQFRAQARLAGAAAALLMRMKRADEELDNVDLRLDGSVDPNAVDEYGYPIVPTPVTDGKAAHEGVYQNMYAKIEEHGDLEAAHQKAMLLDKVETAREQLLVDKKRELDILMGDGEKYENFDEVEREIMGRQSVLKK